MLTLAAALGDSGDLEAALTVQTELVATSRRVRADDHAGTLTAVANLAATHNRMGNHCLAVPLYQEALEVRRRLVGDGHAETLRSVGTLANTVRHLTVFSFCRPAAHV